MMMLGVDVDLFGSQTRMLRRDWRRGSQGVPTCKTERNVRILTLFLYWRG